jgi:hypothetical protein
LNYVVRGAEVGAFRGCEVGWDYNNNVKIEHCENINIDPANFTPKPKIINEEVEFEHVLTPREFVAIKHSPYSKLRVNGELFYIKTIKYSFIKPSKLTLIKAF